MKNTTITHNSFHLGGSGSDGGGGSCNLWTDMKSACCFAGGVLSPLSNPLSAVQCEMCLAHVMTTAEGYVKDGTRNKELTYRIRAVVKTENIFIVSSHLKKKIEFIFWHDYFRLFQIFHLKFCDFWTGWALCLMFFHQRPPQWPTGSGTGSWVMNAVSSLSAFTQLKLACCLYSTSLLIFRLWFRHMDPDIKTLHLFSSFWLLLQAYLSKSWI